MKAVAVVLQSQTCTVQMNNCVRDGTVMSRMTPQKHHMYCNTVWLLFSRLLMRRGYLHYRRIKVRALRRHKFELRNSTEIASHVACVDHIIFDAHTHPQLLPPTWTPHQHAH